MHHAEDGKVLKDKEQIVSGDNLSNQEIIEIWNNTTQGAKINKEPNRNIIEQQSRKQSDRLLHIVYVL